MLTLLDQKSKVEVECGRFQLHNGKSVYICAYIYVCAGNGNTYMSTVAIF